MTWKIKAAVAVVAALIWTQFSPGDSTTTGPTATTAAATSDDREKMLQAVLALQSKAYLTQTDSDFQAAAEAMEKYSAVDPHNLQVEQSVGFIWLDKLNDVSRAYPHLEKAYAIAPDSEWGYLLAKAAGELGKAERRIEVLRDVLKRDPANKIIKDELAGAMSGPQTVPPAIVNPQSAARQKALDLETRAYASKANSDYQIAADALEQYARSNPGDLEVERSVGFLWLDKLKDPARALPHLEKAYALSPDAGWGSLLAGAAAESGHTDRQMQVLRDVVKRNPESAYARVELGQALEKAGLHESANKEFAAAEKIAPDEESVLIAYGQFLHSRGENLRAQEQADKVLADDPKSAAALALLGDVRRDDWNLDDARASYELALAIDPYSESARTGLTNIKRSQAPTLESNYYYFRGSDKFTQQGLYNTLSFSASPHVYINGNFNSGYFTDIATRVPSVIRYQETIAIEDRIDSSVSVRGGVGAFQQPRKEAFGFNLGATWKPISQLWVDASYRTEDPVTDSMFTVSNALSQDILSFTGGYQFNDDLALKLAASRSVYSDNVVREFIHVEPAYTLWRLPNLRLGAEYEAVRYSQQLPGGGGADWYQTYGPVVEAEPSVTNWFSLHFRGELPFVPSAHEFGTNLNLDLKLRPGDHLEFKAGVFYVHVPESISSYSGSGFDASVAYHF